MILCLFVSKLTCQFMMTGRYHESHFFKNLFHDLMTSFQISFTFLWNIQNFSVVHLQILRGMNLQWNHTQFGYANCSKSTRKIAVDVTSKIVNLVMKPFLCAFRWMELLPSALWMEQMLKWRRRWEVKTSLSSAWQWRKWMLSEQKGERWLSFRLSS